MMELSVWEQGEQIGTVTAQQEGLFYIFICKISKHAEQLRRIYVISKWRVEYLGIPNVRRQLCLVHLARDRRRNHRGRMPVPHVVLHDEHGPRAPLLTADDRTEIGIENIATLDSHIHFRFTLREKYHPLH